MKKILFATFVFLCLAKPASSTHIAGGDFSVEWVSGNDFRVTLKLFRDCASGGAGFDSPITIAVYDNVTNLLSFTFTMSAPVITPISLGDACYSPPASVCIQEGVYTTIVTMPNNPNGYYLAWERCCRNPSIQNVAAPGSSGMVFYVQVPDPALQNSTPIFGPYPATGYLCNGLENIIDFGVTEADGDSLVFSLIDPLMGSGTSSTSPTLPGPALPKPYVTINWQPPYSLADIVGGVPPMAVNPATGVITCYPTGSGVFTFAVMCEEYRAGVKISESIRDIQYYVLPCVFDDFPEIMLPAEMDIVVNTTGCFDIVVIDPDATDTISILVTSPVTFADGATLGMPVPYQTSPDTTYQFFFTNETSGLPDSIILPKPTIIGGAYFGVGAIGLQYCWATSCEDVLANPYILDVAAFSLGCSGDTNFLNQTTTLTVVSEPPPSQSLYMPDTLTVLARESTCFDIVVLTTDPADTVNLIVSSSTFGSGATLTQQTPVSTGPNMYEYFFWNPSTGDMDSVTLTAPTAIGNAYTNIGGMGFHYCWATQCENIDQHFFNLQMTSFRIGCFGDTTFLYDNTIIEVLPPEGSQDVVPNVFTPNGDNINDVFRLDGIINYCYDSINVQIFNRWGQLVYESNATDFMWDGKNTKGKEVADGAYFVILNGVYGGKDVTRHYPVHVFRQK
jgi:gliding motility-associated-like protein